MVNVAIVGGSGYTGSELLRLLQSHPYANITAVTSERSAGKAVCELFPHLRNCRVVFEPLEINKIKDRAELFFLCLPHKTSQEVVYHLHEAGRRVIDLSADYRLRHASVYEEWYKTPHRFPSLLRRAVYGLSELYRERIRNAAIVANPGCYPVSAILGLAPALRHGIIEPDSIVIDSKSGVSGAGRSPELPYMFCEANESVRAYAVTVHRHTPEIEQELGLILKRRLKVIFTPHLMPMNRGILTTIYARLTKGMGSSEIQEIYRGFYEGEPFVRVLEEGAYPDTKVVEGTNFCDISVFLDRRMRRRPTLIVVTAIDNLLKGAAGQAVQNMNIMYGFDETTALDVIPAYP